MGILLAPKCTTEDILPPLRPDPPIRAAEQASNVAQRLPVRHSTGCAPYRSGSAATAALGFDLGDCYRGGHHHAPQHLPAFGPGPIQVSSRQFCRSDTNQPRQLLEEPLCHHLAFLKAQFCQHTQYLYLGALLQSAAGGWIVLFALEQSWHILSSLTMCWARKPFQLQNVPGQYRFPRR